MFDSIYLWSHLVLNFCLLEVFKSKSFKFSTCDFVCSMPGFPVLHYLLEFGQTHIHWVNDAIQPSHPVIPFSSLQSFAASGSFPVSQLFASGGQSIGVSALASVLSMNIQDWFPLGLTGFISLLSKGLSRVFSSTIVQKHQLFCAQPFVSNYSHPINEAVEVQKD